jgi:hypothetical protein
VIGSAIFKYLSRSLDTKEKKEKAEADEKSKAEHRQEIDRIRNAADQQGKRVMECLLGHLSTLYFAGEEQTEKYKHRVTLFVVQRTEAGGKQLAVFARAGVYRDSTITWPLDDNDPGKCRGVAGKIWFHRSERLLVTSKEWDDEDPVKQAAYAKSLEIEVAEAARLRVKSKEFFGMPVIVNQVCVGVLLLDSGKTGQITDSGDKRSLFEQYLQLAQAVLSEVRA